MSPKPFPSPPSRPVSQWRVSPGGRPHLEPWESLPRPVGHGSPRRFGPMSWPTQPMAGWWAWPGVPKREVKCAAVLREQPWGQCVYCPNRCAGPGGPRLAQAIPTHFSTLAVSAMRVSTLMDGEPTYHAMVALPSVLLHDIGLVLVHGVMRVAPSCDPLRDDDNGATLGLWLRRGSHSRAWVGESPLCLHPAPFASCIPSPNAKDRVNRSHVRFLM